MIFSHNYNHHHNQQQQQQQSPVEKENRQNNNNIDPGYPNTNTSLLKIQTHHGMKLKIALREFSKQFCNKMNKLSEKIDSDVA